MTVVRRIPVPRVDDPDTGGFFEAAARGELAFQFCSALGHLVHLPRPRCPECGTADLQWRSVRPLGSLYAWTVVRHQIHPDFPVPYTLILVQHLDHPAARLIGVLDGAPGLHAGQALFATFRALTSGEAIVGWQLDDPADDKHP